MKQQTPKQPTFIDSLLQHLFDRIGLNGAAAVQRANAPQRSQPAAPILDERALKAMGYSDADIAYLKRIGQAK